MREPGGGILLDPVRQKQRHTAWSQYLKSSHHGPCRSRYVAWHHRLGGLPWGTSRMWHNPYASNGETDKGTHAQDDQTRRRWPTPLGARRQARRGLGL